VTAQSLLAREARILRLRLEFGLVTLEEIEHWAEAALMSASTPPYELVELAMARSAGSGEALEWLGVVGGDVVVPADIVLAAAAADPKNIEPPRLEWLLDQIAKKSWDYPRQDTPEVGLLTAALGPADALNHALNGGYLSIKDAMERVDGYFREVAEAAKRIQNLSRDLA
jgi:hypothetical protein